METVFSYWADHFDLPILDWIAARLACPALDVLMPAITALGDAGILWIAIAVILLLIPRQRDVGLRMAAALIIGLVVCNLCMKPLFARPRPYDYQWQHYGKAIDLLIEAEHDFSFPSGHTIASFEAATVIAICRKKWGIPAFAVAFLIAFSRLYLYVHYPTDVLCSVVFGIGIGFLACRTMDSCGQCHISRGHG